MCEICITRWKIGVQCILQNKKCTLYEDVLKLTFIDNK